MSGVGRNQGVNKCCGTPQHLSPHRKEWVRCVCTPETQMWWTYQADGANNEANEKREEETEVGRTDSMERVLAWVSTTTVSPEKRDSNSLRSCCSSTAGVEERATGDSTGSMAACAGGLLTWPYAPDKRYSRVIDPSGKRRGMMFMPRTKQWSESDEVRWKKHRVRHFFCLWRAKEWRVQGVLRRAEYNCLCARMRISQEGEEWAGRPMDLILLVPARSL